MFIYNHKQHQLGQKLWRSSFFVEAAGIHRRNTEENRVNLYLSLQKRLSKEYLKNLRSLVDWWFITIKLILIPHLKRKKIIPCFK